MPARPILVAVATTLISIASAHAAKPRIPEIPLDLPVVVSSQEPSKSLKGGSYAVPDSHYGIFSHQKSSKLHGGLGLIGGLAHGAKLRSAAKAQSGERVLFENDLSVMLTEADTSFIRDESKPENRIELTPAATYFFTTDREFSMTCVIEATIFKQGRSSDDLRITVSASPILSLSDEALGGKVHEQLQKCMKRSADILAMLRQHGTGEFQRATISPPNGKPISWYIFRPAFPQRFITADGNRVNEFGVTGAARTENIRFETTD